MKKIFEVIFEDGVDVYKEYLPCENKKQVEKWIEGNGEILRIKEYEINLPIPLDFIQTSLRNSGFSDMEITLISRALIDCNFIE